MPDSEPARAAADSARSRVRRRTSRVGLAWAASLTLAVGAGWLGRELALQRGLDLPDPLDVRRQSVQTMTEDEAETPERFEEEVSAELQEGLRRDVAAEQEPNAAETPARQKSEAKVIAPAEEAPVGRGAEVGKMDAREMDARKRGDAELAAVAARPAPEVDNLAADVLDPATEGRAQFAARPPDPGSVVDHPAVGCWYVERGGEVSGAPARIRLTDERVPGQNDGSLRLETESDPLPGSAQVWMPLGADSVWVSVPPRVFRLAHGDSVLNGLVMVPADLDPAVVTPSEVRYARVECSAP
jgi:hypothetical protein